MISPAVITLTRGSDLVMRGTLSEAGAPIDISGATIDLFDPHEALGAQIAWLDVTQGAFEVSAAYTPAWPDGRVMTFRIAITQSGRTITSPLITVNVT